MNFLLDIIATLYDAKNFDDIGKIIISILREFAHGQEIGGKIGIYDKEIGEYKVYYNSYEQKPFDIFQSEMNKMVNKTCRFSEIQYFSRIVADTKKKLIIQDNHSDESLKIQPAQKEIRNHAMLWVPLVYNNEFLGIISVGSEPANSITNEILEIIEGIAKITSIKVYELLTTKKLIESEKKYRTLVESADDAIVLTDLNGKHLYRNKAYYTSLGFEDGEEIGFDGFARVHPEDIPKIKNEFPKLYEKGTLTAEYRTKHKNGNWRYHQIKTVLIRDQDNKPESLLSIIRDITDQRLSEEMLRKREAEFNAMFNSITDGVVFSDKQRKIVLVNPAFTNMFGYSLEELYGKTTEILYPDKESYKAQRAKYQMGDITGQYLFEITYRRKDGNLLTTETLGVPVKDSQREIIGYLGIHRDITERKQAEDALMKQYTLLDGILESHSSPIFSVDTKYRYTSFNKSHAAVMKALYDMDIKIGKNILNYMTVPIDAETAKENFNRAMKGENYIASAYSGEAILNRRYFEVFHNPIRDANGFVIGVAVLASDITDRKQAEEALKQVEEKYRNIFESAMEGIYQTTLQGQFLIANPALARMLGYDSAEDLISSVQDIGHQLYVQPEQRKEFLRRIEEYGIVQGFECQLFRKDRGKIWVLLKGHAVYGLDGKILYSEGILEDITERKQAEEILRESEERFRTIFEEGPIGMVTSGLDFRFTKVNSAFCNMIGYSEEELTSLTFKDITHPEHIIPDIESVNKVLNNEIPFYKTEKRYVRKDGSIVWGAATITSIRNNNGQFLHFIVMIEDITERKRVENQIKEALAWQEAIFEGSLDAILISDMDSRFVTVNNAAEKLTGFSKTELLSMRIPDLHDHPDLKAYFEFHDRIMAGEDIISEAKILRKDGLKVDAEFNNKSILISGSQFMHTTARDITERKRSEETLRQSEARMRAIIEGTPHLFFYTQDAQANNTYVSPTVERITGYEADIWLNRIDWFITDSEINQIARKGTHAHLRGEFTEGPLLVEVQHAEGYPILLEVYENSIIQNGKIVGLQGVAHDITKRKQIEEFLKIERDLGLALSNASSLQEVMEHCFNAAINVSGMDSGGIYIVNEDGSLDLLSSEGLSEEFIRTVSHYDFDTNNARLVHAGKPIYVLNESLGVQLDEMRKKEGLKVIASVPIQDQGKVVASLNIASHILGDIPKQKQIMLEDIVSRMGSPMVRAHTEELLRESEAKYRLLFETMEQGVMYLDVNGRIIFANPSAELILGLKIDHMLHRAVIGPLQRTIHEDGSIFPDETHPAMVVLSTGQSVSNITMGVFHPQKEKYIWVLISATPQFRDGETKPFQVFETFTDITERKQAEEALRQSEEKFRTIVETTNEWIWDLSLDGRHTYSNPAIEFILGYSPEEIVGKNAFDFMHEEEKERIGKILPSFIKERKGWQDLVVRWRHKDGTYRYLESNSTPIFDQQGELVGFRGADRDITERKKAEAEHLRLQNLESLGILAGGIAHDFNNILTTIMGQASISLLKSKDENMKKSLSGILEATKRAVGLTQQLLTFAKGGTPQKTIISIRKLLEDITKFSLSGSNVEVEFEFKDTLSIEADYGQISQVIQNIVINSKQAMPGGGKVKISTEDFMIDEEKPYLKITLKDNGVGILPEHLNKIFDPYFSTKQSGSGLGLSVCHSIINRHGGKIFVNSQFGIGTTFEILLPTSEQGIRKPEEKQNIVTQKLRVLIMDDEDSIREILKEILIELGHNVIESLEGNEAIKFYKQSLEEKEPFDIIFLDLTIKGGLGGKETVKKLREINQKVKVVVSSGYADSSIAGFKEAGFDAKLNKPYTIEEVNEVIFQIVNK